MFFLLTCSKRVVANRDSLIAFLLFISPSGARIKYDYCQKMICFYDIYVKVIQELFFKSVTYELN